MQPVVVPVVINGFWRAFNRKGLVFKKRGTNLSVQFKPPIDIDYSKTIDEILDIIMDAIEQSAEFKLKGRHHRLQPS
jgi:1-acyl-sn-glycerol-3-phosphate acyltransferase